MISRTYILSLSSNYFDSYIIVIIQFCFILDEMRVTNVAKRHPPFNHWEPIYIGTNEEPLYDERLSWEGRADKMTQVSYKHRTY